MGGSILSVKKSSVLALAISLSCHQRVYFRRLHFFFHPRDGSLFRDFLGLALGSPDGRFEKSGAVTDSRDS